MKTYTVTAKRWDHGWELHVDGLGVTQTRSLALAERDAKDYIEILTNKTNPKINLQIELGEFDEKVVDLKASQEAVQRMLAESATRARILVQDLRDAGLSGEDIARILDVTPQRVSQLVKAK